MKSVSLLATAISATLLMSGCNVFKKNGTTVDSENANVKTTTVTGQPKPASAETLIEPLLGSWSVTTINGEEVKVNGDNHPEVTFKAIPEAKTAILVIGFNGCNYLNGTWKVTTAGIEPAGAFASTMRACQDAPYEFIMNKALDQVTGYTFGPDSTLELKNESNGTVMKLRKRLLSFLNGAWKIDTINGTKVPASADVKVVIDVDECKIHGNAGCNLLNGDVIVNLDKGDGIEFKNLATTRMTCPDIATEQQFLLALEEVDTAVQGATANNAVMKNSQGKTVLTMHRISAEELGDM